MSHSNHHPVRENLWRYAFVVMVTVGSLLWILTLEPIAQDPAYHSFADRRAFLGIPNFIDVITSIPFLIIGLAGVRLCLGTKNETMRSAWLILFCGVALVSLGSGYYHLNPSDDSLVWDRLPMTIGFMGLFIALLGEYLNQRVATLLLYPALLLGLASVVFWVLSGDLRPYIWVQLLPLITIPTVMALFRSKIPQQWLLLVALGLYLLAKITELHDSAVFLGTWEMLSGHSLKHLLAAAATWCILVMLQKGKLIKLNTN